MKGDDRQGKSLSEGGWTIRRWEKRALKIVYEVEVGTPHRPLPPTTTKTPGLGSHLALGTQHHVLRPVDHRFPLRLGNGTPLEVPNTPKSSPPMPVRLRIQV